MITSVNRFLPTAAFVTTVTDVVIKARKCSYKLPVIFARF